MTTGNARQYATSERLAARARLHREFSIAETPWFTWLAPRLCIVAGERVLDIGCGPGWFWESVAGDLPASISLTLLDQSAGMVDEARQRCRELRNWTVSAIVGDAVQLPFEDASFDRVIAMHMLYHVADKPAAVGEMHRVLRPGGTLAVTCNGERNMRELYGLTTAFGSPPTDPSATALGFEQTEHLLGDMFGNVSRDLHPGGLRVTDPEVVFLALTSYPPGSDADEDQLGAFRRRIGGAFAEGGGVLEVSSEVGLFVSRKSD
jgi:SAM-dependent methyltransferase